jgi:hypothetical protein
MRYTSLALEMLGLEPWTAFGMVLVIGQGTGNGE